MNLPPLDQQEMHGQVRKHNKHPRKHAESNDIFPERQVVEAKSAQNRRSGHFDVQTESIVALALIHPA
jgi:hypothetical protein